MSFSIETWYETISREDVLISHRGFLSSELITGLLDSIEKQMEERGVTSKVRKKLYNILVEALQNLFHHSSKSPVKNNHSPENIIFVLSYSDGLFHINTGNYVESAKVGYLQDRIKQINHLNPEELKSLYKLILNNEEFSEKGGGGLGMIDIARKSGNKLVGDFHIIDKNFYYFCFNVKV